MNRAADIAMSDSVRKFIGRKLADDTMETARAAWRKAMQSSSDDDAHIAVAWCVRAAVAARRASMTKRAAMLDDAGRRVLAKFPAVARELDDIAALPQAQRTQAVAALNRRIGLADWLASRADAALEKGT